MLTACKITKKNENSYHFGKNSTRICAEMNNCSILVGGKGR